jgi:hypothetical protein
MCDLTQASESEKLWLALRFLECVRADPLLVAAVRHAWKLSPYFPQIQLPHKVAGNKVQGCGT